MAVSGRTTALATIGLVAIAFKPGSMRSFSLTGITCVLVAVAGLGLSALRRGGKIRQ